MVGKLNSHIIDDVFINVLATIFLNAADKKMRYSAYKDIGEKKFYQEQLDNLQTEQEDLFKEIEYTKETFSKYKFENSSTNGCYLLHAYIPTYCMY